MARPIHPPADAVALGQAPGRVGLRRLDLVDEHLAALDGRHGASARCETIGGGEELVEPMADALRTDRPLRLIHNLRRAGPHPRALKTTSLLTAPPGPRRSNVDSPAPPALR